MVECEHRQAGSLGIGKVETVEIAQGAFAKAVFPGGRGGVLQHLTRRTALPQIDGKPIKPLEDDTDSLPDIGDTMHHSVISV